MCEIASSEHGFVAYMYGLYKLSALQELTNSSDKIAFFALFHSTL